MKNCKKIVCRIFLPKLAIFGIMMVIGFSKIAVAIEPLCGTSQLPSVTPDAAKTIIDGKPSTSYSEGHNEWQSVIIDLKCSRTIFGLRRYMVNNQPNTSRDLQGESWQYSTDGANWKDLTGTNTFGWSSYNNYVPHAWHSVDYGWSTWLKPNSPITARYIKYAFDRNNDSVGEVEVDTRTALSSHAAINGTSAQNVIDSDIKSKLSTNHQDWQSLTIDLGRVVQLSMLRRYMEGNDKSRGIQGEGWEISSDGVSFKTLVASDVTGWESYTNYVPHAWHSLPYGWSAWLTLKSPQPVRFIRFKWDGNADSLNEIEFSDMLLGSDTNYDFSFADPSFAASVSLPNYSGTTQLPSLSKILSDPNVGFTGFYTGILYGNNGLDSQVSATLQQSNTGEVRGMLTVTGVGKAGVKLSGNLFCSDQIIPIGSRLAIRLKPWTPDSNPAHFYSRHNNIHYNAYYDAKLGDTERFAFGSTSRPISGFGTSGTVRINMYAHLYTIKDPNNRQSKLDPLDFGFIMPVNGSSHLWAEVEVETPCNDGRPLRLYLTRYDDILLKTLGLSATTRDLSP